MGADHGLDMSLEDLIKKSRTKSKPAAGGARAKVAQKPGGKAGQQKPGQAAKGKPAAGAAAAKKGGVRLQAKGGVGKPGAKPAAGQQRPGHQRLRQQPDVRVVPRAGGARPGAAAARPGARGPAAAAGARPGPGGAGRQTRGMMPYMGGGGPGPMMQQRPPMMAMAPGMMMPAMMMQQPMMQQPAPVMQQAPQQQAAPAQGKWQNDLFDGSVVSSSTSAKLLVSNLDHKVTDDDIKELFGTVGTIKESGIHYDKSGRSLGSATVVFEKRPDALAAFNRYNNVALDNKKMLIEVVEAAVPRGTFKTLSSGINVSRPQQQAGGASGARGRGQPQSDMMQE